MIRRFASIALIVTTSCLAASAQVSAQSKEHPSVTAERLAAIRRAKVWVPTDIASLDIMAGPQGPGAFPPNATVMCDYVDKKMGGRSPKFMCVIRPDDEVKVKYGRLNGEVYAEVAASRLLWALGFFADRMYPVRLVCRGCPTGIQDTEVASIQRKFPGKDIETDSGEGWAWPELDLVDSAAGGAPRAQRDALKLLAVFIQHTDSKPEQQRLVCMGTVKDEKIEDHPKSEKSEKSGDRPKSDEKQKREDRPQGEDKKGQEPCAETAMLVHDLGQTFGQANVFNRSSVSSVNLDQWLRVPVWKDPARCIANLKLSFSGTLNNPPISEEGRKFLADLLIQLSDTQLHQLFEVSRFPKRSLAAPGVSDSVTIGRWVDAFKKKRNEVVNTTCPS